ncbi:MAG: hypothetical protein FJW20_07700 [Acidimicrobiia bacterium]|nr:hypothetical protein [Acidimicrobiia bacterium]
MRVAENHHRGWIGPVLLLLIVIGFYWKLVLTNQFTWLQGADLAHQVLPWFQFQVGEIQQGRLPLWDPYMWGGQPLIGQAQPGTAYPLNWILFVLPTNNGWMRQAYLHWYFVLIHYMAAAFAYWLCRDLKLSRTASLAGGLVFGLGGFVGHTDWPQMLNGAVWAPLVLMFVFRSLRGEKPWASAGLAGIGLGMAVLSGHHQVPIFLGVAMGGLWIWGTIRSGRPDWGVTARAAVFLIVAGMVSGLQSLPAYEYSKLAYRWVSGPYPVTHEMPVPYIVHADYSLAGQSLLGMVFPNILHHTNLFVGFTAVILAVLGIAASWHRREVRICTVIALGGLGMAFGASVVIYGFLYSVLPMMEKARNPSMAAVIFHLGLSVLTAFGLQRAGDGEASEGWLRRLQYAAFGFAAVIFAGWFFAMVFLKQKAFESDTTSAFTALLALIAAGCLAGRRAGQLGFGAFTTALVILMLVELGNGGISVLRHVDSTGQADYLSALSRDKELVETLRALPEGRTQLDPEQVKHNVADWNGIEMWHGYLASMLRHQFDMAMHEIRPRELFGVRYAVSKEPLPGWDREVAWLSGDLRVFENPNAFPRAWIVHGLEKGSPEKLLEALQDHRFDFRKKGLMESEPPPLEQCSTPEQLWTLSRVTNRTIIYTELGCRGMLMMNDTYYPGWTARLNGQPAELHRVNGSQRGVVLPAGRHLVEVSYRPTSVYAGFVLSVLGLGLGIGVRRLDGRSKL